MYRRSIKRKLLPFVRKLPSNLGRLFVVLYLVLMVISLILFGVSRLFSDFDYSACVVLGGRQVCTLIGVYIMTVASLPGYLISAILINSLKIKPPLVISYLFVILTSALVYYLLGRAFQKIKDSAKDSEKLVLNLVIIIFSFFAVLAVMLKLIYTQYP